MQAIRSAFCKFTIRTLLVTVVVSLLAIIGVGMTLLIQALDQFREQLREGSVIQAEMINNAMVCNSY